jgi:two-component system NarL family response regulator
MPSKSIRVLCVEDHQIVREGLILIVDRHPDMTVVGSSSSGEEGVELYKELLPDVTVMDLQLPAMSGVDAIRAIRSIDANAKIVVLTMYGGDEDIFRALEAGATTYLLKDTVSDDLIGVIREVHSGEHPVRRDVEAKLAERASGPTLTRRETEVMELIATGMRNREIGKALNISEETVHVHVRKILSKLRVPDRTAALKEAVHRGIIHLS